jgi:hypothetical protein
MFVTKNWHVHQFVMIHNKWKLWKTCQKCVFTSSEVVGITVAVDDLPGLGRRRAFITGEDKKKLRGTYCTITNGYGPIEKYKERKVGDLVQ